MASSSDPPTDHALLDELRRRATLLDAHIGEFLPADEADELAAASTHLFEAGGKRLRPVTALLSAEIISGHDFTTIDYRAVPDAEGTPVDVAKAAYALEVIHTFSLVHDDIMDDDDLRRGVPAVHRAFDTDTAILSGDYLYAKAYDLLLDCGAKPARLVEAAQMVTRTTMTLCTGQADDIAFESRDRVEPDEYIEMVRGKTAALYGASAALPAILLGASEETSEALYDFGVDVGVAFQIQDDVLDLTCDTEALGKDGGSDLLEQKKTLISLHALQNGVSPDDIFPETDDPATIREAVEVLEETDSIEYAQQEARDLVERGRARLHEVESTPSLVLLDALAEFLITRDA